MATIRQARAQQRVFRRLLRPLGPVLLLIWTATSLPTPGGHGRNLGVWLALAGFVGFGLATLLTRNKTGFWPFASVAGLIASSVVLVWRDPSGPGVIGIFLGLIMIARQFSRWTATGLVVAAFAVLTANTIYTSKGDHKTALLAELAFAGFYGALYLVNRLGDALEQAERLLVEVDQMQAERARAAALAERQRLAREMHDVLAHSLSGLMLQLAGAKMLAAQAPGDPRLAGTIEHAHQLAKSGLSEARRAIGLLRDEELPGPERLRALVEEFEQDRGVPCEFTVSGPARELDSQARLAVYRVAQEALTNITKHANPDRVTLNLAYEPDATRLIIEDYAAETGRATAAGQPGYGLTGMRERAELLGGKLTTATTGNGFRVELQVPC
jgi:signal transduction histidine kinase